MFDHVTLRPSDRAASERFYDTVLATLGIEQRYRSEQFGAPGARPEYGVDDYGGFLLDPAEHVHMAYAATDNAAVEAFHAAPVGAGFRGNGAPGERSDYHDAFVLDPDGDNVEVVNHNR